MKSYGVIGDVVYGVYYDSPYSKEAGSTVSTRWVNTEKKAKWKQGLFQEVWKWRHDTTYYYDNADLAQHRGTWIMSH